MSRSAAILFAVLGSVAATLICLLVFDDAGLALGVAGLASGLLWFALSLWVRAHPPQPTLVPQRGSEGSRTASADRSSVIIQGDGNHVGDTVQSPVEYLDPADVTPREWISNVPREPR